MSAFIRSLGRPFVASALRRVGEAFQAGASEWFIECGIVAPLRTSGALLLLQERGPQGVIEIATELRQSHPTIIVWIKELDTLGLIQSRPSNTDGRRNIISLTQAGEEQAAFIRSAQNVLAGAYATLCAEAGTDIFEGVLRLEELCRRQSMAERLREQAIRSRFDTQSDGRQTG